MRTIIQESLLNVLRERRSGYANPVNSQTLSVALNITPTYVREQMSDLQKQQLVAVRRGPKGGYYLMPTEKPLRLQIDDITVEHQAASFGTVYPDLVKRLNEEEKVIVEMSLNGVNVLPDGVNDVPSEKVEQVVIRTKTMKEFAIDLIETAEEYLPKLTTGMIQIASQFHAGREQEAHALLAEAIEGLEWADSCFAGLGQWAAKNGNHELLVIAGTYQNQLVSVSLAMEQQNITELADLLEYEVASTTEEGLKCLQVLRDLIKG